MRKSVLFTVRSLTVNTFRVIAWCEPVCHIDARTARFFLETRKRREPRDIFSTWRRRRNKQPFWPISQSGGCQTVAGKLQLFLGVVAYRLLFEIAPKKGVMSNQSTRCAYRAIFFLETRKQREPRVPLSNRICQRSRKVTGAKISKIRSQNWCEEYAQVLGRLLHS